MNVAETRLIMRGCIKLLKSVRSKRMMILENPYTFDEVLEALEERASFLQKYFFDPRKHRTFVTRRRLYTNNGRVQQNIKIVDGLPVHKSGKAVLHPNGRPWTAQESAAELAQVKYRELPEVAP